MKIALTWTLPTARTDGTALAPTDIAKVSIFDASGGGALITDLPADAVSFTTPDDKAPGSYAFGVTVTDTAGNVSSEATVGITVPVPALAPPNPVSNLAAALV